MTSATAKFVLTIIATLTWPGACHAQDTAAAWLGERKATQELMSANNRLTRAYLNEKMSILREMLDEAHVHNNVFGMQLTKKQFLRDIEEGILEFDSYTTQEIKWHVDTNTAVATGVIKAQAVRDGKKVPANQFLFTRVFVRRHGQWKVLLFHNTMIPAPKETK